MTPTPRENIMKVLKGERPAWIPLAACWDDHNHPDKGSLPPELAARIANIHRLDETTILFSRHLGLDIIDNSRTGIAIRRRKIQRNVSPKDEQGRVTTTWQTRHGELRSVRQYSAESGVSSIIEYPVKDRDDLPRLACLSEDMEFYVLPEDREAQPAHRQLIGNDGIKPCAVCGTPLASMIRDMAGVETMAYLWVDARRELHDLFTVMEATNRQWFELAMTLDNDAVIAVDDTSTTCISPDMFEEFCLGYTDRMAEIVHAAGRFYLHHSCGLIRDLLPLYRQTKMDAVHSFTIPPVGNVGIAEGRQLLGNDITIMVEILAPFCMEVHSGRRAEAARGIQTLFQEADPGNRLLLVLAAEPFNTMEEMEFIVRECRKYQRMYSE